MYEWVVVGADWAVITTGEAVAVDLADRLDGRVLDGDRTAGSPVSYSSIDPCP
jgi:hypothetical protein